MITGPDAITAMRNLNDIISEMQDVNNEEFYSPAQVAAHFSHELEQWRDEIIKGGGIQPVTSYRELLAPGATL